MTDQLQYGFDSRVQFDFAPGVLLAHCGPPSGRPLEDLQRAVTAALDKPLEFPSLREALAPGDHVALALESHLPLAGKLVSAIVDYLRRGGIEPSHVTVLQSPGDVPIADQLEAEYNATVAPDDRPVFATHDPHDRKQLAYLSATEAGDPVYLNRRLCDADLVLPIGGTRPRNHAGSIPEYLLYPTFADAEAQQRPNSPAKGGKGHRTKAPRPDMAWMLGVQLMIRVVPGAGDSILQVFAGLPAAVEAEADRACQQAWSQSVPQRASLVVAAIEGGSSQQTWRNLGRALAAAGELVADHGAIAVCCEIDAPPGPAVRTISRIDDPHQALHRIRRKQLPDTETAWQLARAREKATVYLLSRLDESLLEDLGIAPVTNGKEITRLASRHKSCILLSSAQNALPHGPEE